jgi:Lrp/AsnC family leucine-responsive transcriptional regulator
MPGLKKHELLDEINLKLLRELEQDASLSGAELGRRLHLSIPTVTQRRLRLEDAGVITGYHAQLDPKKFALLTAFIRLSVNGDGFARVSAVVRDSPEVVECHRATGTDSFIMKAHGRSVEGLESLVSRFTPYGTAFSAVVTSSPIKRRGLIGALESTQPRAPSRVHGKKQRSSNRG